MSKERLSQIIGNGARAFDMLPADTRAALIARHEGNIKAAQAVAFDALPEDVRIAWVRASGAVPVDCAGAIVDAPARGPVRAFDLLASYPKGNGESELKPAGFAGRKTMKRADVFDTMRGQAARRGGVLVLSDSQIGMGRIYRGLVDDRNAGAVRCSSLEAMGGGIGGTREGFTDHRLDMSRRIDRLRAAVGSGVAMAVRRVRPSDRGGVSRRNIADLALVDAVCLDDLDISAVLRLHHWAVKGDTVRALTVALGAALDRMIGPVHCRKVYAMQSRDPVQSIFDREK